MNSRKICQFFTLLILTVFLLCCTNQQIRLVGAGATFPEPFYRKIFTEYETLHNIEIEYHGIGSGGGIKQITAKTVDFGASDVVTFNTEHDNLIYIPTCLSAVAVTYNLPGFPDLFLTPEIIADIYLGKIKNWNNPSISDLNPILNDIKEKIIVIHRQESSGTTFIFSEYLTKINDEWKEKIGTGKSLSWPVGIGAKGNEGIIKEIKKRPYSIAYVNLDYSLKNNLPVAFLKNKKGNYIKPDLDSVSVTGNVPFSFKETVSITNTEESTGYPITSFTWIIAQKEQYYNNNSFHRANALYNLLAWIIIDGQSYTKELFYAPLPGYAINFAQKQLKSMQYKSKFPFKKKPI